jgi:hypothetical protein
MTILRTSFLYTKMYNSAFSGLIDAENDEIKAMLLSEDYSPNMETHQFKSDLSHEVAGTGYDAGGIVLENVTITNPSNGVFKLDCDDPEFDAINVTFHYVVIYNNTPATDAERPLLCCVNMGENLEFNGENFKSIISANGIFTITNE